MKFGMRKPSLKRSFSARTMDVKLERESVSGKKIMVHVVRLPFIFEDDYEATKDCLRKSILQIFEEGNVG